MLLRLHGLVTPSSPALWSCTPLLTTFRPAMSQACLTAALAFSIQCSHENQDGLPGLPGSPASLHSLPPGSTHFPGALQVLSDSWALALIRPTKPTSVPRALIQVHHVPQFIVLWVLQGSGGWHWTPTKQPEDPLSSSVTHTVHLHCQRMTST